MAIEPLKNANVAIFTDVSFRNVNSTPDSMLTELCRNIGVTISNGGDVLIPCHSSGVIYDLIDYLRKYLNSLNLHSTNMYFVSSSSEHSLAYSNISSEWMCETKQMKTYEASDPFDHGSMLRNGDLKIFTGLNTSFANVFHQNKANPCIIFTGDPSLRFGEITHLIKLFNKNPKNSMILIEPEYDFERTIGIYKSDLKMQVVHCPIDLRLNTKELIHLINEINPEHKIVQNFFKNEELIKMV
jgi:integrator complex subunit 9